MRRSAVGLIGLLCACPASQPTPDPKPQPAKPAVAIASPAVFVVYSRDTTYVIPAHPRRVDQPRLEVRGLWALGEGNVAWIDSRCNERRTRSTEGAVTVESCAELLLSAGASCDDDEEEETEATDEEEDEENDPCAGEMHSEGDFPASLVGGNLYGVGFWTNNGCSGVNLSHWSAEIRALDDAAWSKLSWKPGGCVGVNSVTVDSLLQAVPEDGGEKAAAAQDYCCKDGKTVDEPIYVQRGQELLELTVGYYMAVGCVHYRRTTVTPNSCPTTADPCGSPRRFQDAGGGELWIASDGSAALDPSGGAVYAPGKADPIWRGAHIKEIIGVRYHADGGPLRKWMGCVSKIPTITKKPADKPKAIKPIPKKPLAAKKKLTPRQQARAEVSVGRQYLRLKKPELAAAAFQRALKLRPKSCRITGEAGWVAFRGGDLASARKLTRAALKLCKQTRIRASLFYNLGRIAEAEKKTDAAVKHYQRSLKLRPSKAVKRRLQRLSTSD